MAISYISVPGLHDDVMGSAGEEGSNGHRTAGYSAPQESRDWTQRVGLALLSVLSIVVQLGL